MDHSKIIDTFETYHITILIKIMLVACLIKNYFVITYLLEDE